MIRSVFTLSLVLLVGCAPRLEARDHDAGRRTPRDAGPFPTSSGAFEHTVTAEGVITTVVDATGTDAWQRLDLDTGLAVDAGEGWDLAFSRFRGRTNGGVSGSGGVLAARLPGQPFETLTRAPEDGWLVDRLGPEDTVENAFHGGEEGADDWYEYTLATHTLTPRDVTYVVASTEARFYKLRFLSYYDGAGTPAVVRFAWAEIDPPLTALPDAGPPVLDGGVPQVDGGAEPVPDTTLTVDASDRERWVYVRLGAGVVTPADPTHGGDWDLAFRRTTIRTSSGTSGPGLGGARAAPEGVAYDEVLSAGTLGYAADALSESAVPGSEPTSRNPILTEWFDYDVRTHTVRVGARVYLVRTADGGYAKLRIWRWVDGVYELSFAPVERRPELVELLVDASAAGGAFVSLRDGAEVEGDGDRWDLALSGERMATHGGASAPGLGAALQTDARELDQLDAVPERGWVLDQPELGNPALAAWRDAGGAPRPVVFAVRTADGHAAAFRVLSHEAGLYRLALTFAGPGQRRFRGDL